MKSIKFLSLLLLGLCLLQAPQAMAAKLAPFPSSAALQPIPAFSHPNVSGNIDHTTVTGNYQSVSTSSANSSNTNNPEEKSSHSNILFWLSVWLAIISSFFALVLIIMRRR